MIIKYNTKISKFSDICKYNFNYLTMILSSSDNLGTLFVEEDNNPTLAFLSFLQKLHFTYNRSHIFLQLEMLNDFVNISFTFTTLLPSYISTMS